MEVIPPELLLAPYPDGIRDVATALRAIVRRAVPDATERVRPRWRLIGFDVPAGRRTAYFAYVAPEHRHIHLGFQFGAFMADPERVLEGAHLHLRRVRYLTFMPGQSLPESLLSSLTREAAAIAALSPHDRVGLALDREWHPEPRT